MNIFAKERGRLLPELLQLPNGAPSADTFERVFQRLDVSSLQESLEKYGQTVLSTLSEKQIVHDGKKLKGVSLASKGNRELYILNAWVSENRICTGQSKVQDKSNEITAIPEILESIDITDATVSIDVTGTQTKIAEQTVTGGGHYFLSVKGNQRELPEDVESAFRTHAGYDRYESVKKEHGRIENRCCSILSAGDYLPEENLSTWKNVSMLIKIEVTREEKGTKQAETRYYISDDVSQKAIYYDELARDHRGIENHLHWHLDIAFGEDTLRARKGYTPENLSTLRKFALQIISNVNDKHSLKKRQYKAALDINYMKKIIEDLMRLPCASTENDNELLI